MTTMTVAPIDSLPLAREARCVVGQSIARIPKRERVAVTNLICTPVADGGVPAEEVAMRLAVSGLRGSAMSIYRHREGRCRCFRSAIKGGAL